LSGEAPEINGERCPKLQWFCNRVAFVLTAPRLVREKWWTVTVHAFRRRVTGQPRSRRVWQAIVAALAVLVFFGDIGQTGHLLLTAHVRCPYDGALVHEDELPSSVRTFGAGNSAPAPLPVSAVPQHEHEDCGVLGVSHRVSALVVAGRPGEVCGVERVQPPAWLGSRPRAARSILSYAPKLSPPV
jgi:hypothetical protein